MKQLLKKTIQLLHPFFNKIGYVHHSSIIDAQHKNSLLNVIFSNFKTIGFTPNHILDVGANHGTWTREILQYYPNAYYTLIEPQEWLKPSFQDLLDSNPKIKYFPVGAGKTNGSLKFTIVNRDDSCSYRYTPEEALTKGYTQVDIPVMSINTLISENNLPIPNLIKIDAEGLDLEVLKGATNFIGITEVFFVEAAIINKEFDNSILKMINFMDNNGYNLFDISDINRPFKPSLLWLVELVFVKKNGLIDSYKHNFEV
jgi:FkbM family methyltransferase